MKFNASHKNVSIVPILGEDWTIEFLSKEDDERFENADGFCSLSARKIGVHCIEECEHDDPERHTKRVLRHEIIHAMLFESGLGLENTWDEEQMVDWFARQMPKLAKVFKDLDCLGD